MPSQEYFKIVWLGLLTIANLAVWPAVIALEPGELTVAFLNVGQGDAIFIETPYHNQILIDGGPPGRAAVRALGHFLPATDRSLDLVVATHPDADHVGGLARVLERYPPLAVVETPLEGETGVYAEFAAARGKSGARRLGARRGQVFNLDHGVRLEIFFPDRVFQAGSNDSNLSSIVAKLSYGQIDFLLTGDAPSGIEKYLISLDPAALDVEVLKVGHHGSKTSSDPYFLAATTPDYAVISAGRGNRYGHPHAEVLAGLADVGAKIHRTAEEGNIVFTTDGETLSVR